MLQTKGGCCKAPPVRRRALAARRTGAPTPPPSARTCERARLLIRLARPVLLLLHRTRPAPLGAVGSTTTCSKGHALNAVLRRCRTRRTVALAWITPSNTLAGLRGLRCRNLRRSSAACSTTGVSLQVTTGGGQKRRTTVLAPGAVLGVRRGWLGGSPPPQTRGLLQK